MSHMSQGEPSCHICLQENLTFNHYNDGSDIFNAVLDVITLFIDYNRQMNLVFKPFTFDNKCVLLNDQFIDPETNFFNDIICNNTYLCENEFFKSFSSHTDINNIPNAC